MPLDGIRVLEFAHAMAGPFCGGLLGDFGAEVIKVERAGSGDSLAAHGAGGAESLLVHRYKPQQAQHRSRPRRPDDNAYVKDLSPPAT